MFIFFLSLGSNLDDREAMLKSAIDLLNDGGRGTAKIKIKKTSRTYKTEPWGGAGIDWFLNCAVEGETSLTPEELLQRTQEIEKNLGRDLGRGFRRDEKHGKSRDKSALQKYASRTIDIDILFYGDSVIHTQNLIVPHPEISQRNFVLQPLAEIAPDLTHPQSKKTIKQLLNECADTSIVMPHDNTAHNS